MHLGRLLMARGEYEDAERILLGVNERWRAIGSAASVHETSIHLADCLVRAGRAGEALDVLAQDHGAGPEETAMFDASSAAVTARALVELGRIDEARATLCRGFETARERSLTFDTARLLLSPLGSAHPSTSASERPSRPRRRIAYSTGSVWSTTQPL